MTIDSDPIRRLPVEIMHMIFMRLTYADCQRCITLSDHWRDALFRWPRLYQRLGGYNYDLIKTHVDHVRSEWITEMDFSSEEHMFRKLQFIVRLHCSNVRRVKIRCKGDKTMTKFVELLEQTGDQLRYLQLTVTDDAVSVNDPIQQVFEHCPNLVYFDYHESSILLTRTYGTIIRSRMMHEYPVLRHLTHLHLGMFSISGPSEMCANIIKYTPSLIQFSASTKNCPRLSTLTTACPRLSAVLRESVDGLSTQTSCIQRLDFYEEDPLIAPATFKNDNTTTATTCLTTIQTHVTDEILPSTTMRSLAVNVRDSNNADLVRMIGDPSWPVLTTLYLSDSPRSFFGSLMTPLAILVKYCPNLVHLGLSTQRFVTDENVDFIMNNMPHVTWLQLVGPSSHVSSEKLVQLAQCDNLKHLDQLRFQALEQVNDDVLDALIGTRLDTLISLSLEHGLRVTDAGVRHLVHELKKGKYQLRRLQLSNLLYGKVSSSIVRYARSQLPHIHVTDEIGDILHYISEDQYP